MNEAGIREGDLYIWWGRGSHQGVTFSIRLLEFLLLLIGLLLFLQIVTGPIFFFLNYFNQSNPMFFFGSFVKVLLQFLMVFFYWSNNWSFLVLIDMGPWSCLKEKTFLFLSSCFCMIDCYVFNWWLCFFAPQVLSLFVCALHIPFYLDMVLLYRCYLQCYLTI